MSLTVHHLQVSQSERIVWLCEELGIPYSLQLHQRNPLLSPPDLQALHPMKAAPVIVDSTFTPEQPLVLAESAACAEWIVQKHGNGRLSLPPSHPNYSDYLYWYAFANGSLQPVTSLYFRVSVLKLDPSNFIQQSTIGGLDKNLSHLDQRLGQVTWLAGSEFTTADIMSVYSLTTGRVFSQIDLGKYKNILAYLKRVSERPAYQRAMEKGDPGMKPALNAEPPARHPALP